MKSRPNPHESKAFVGSPEGRKWREVTKKDLTVYRRAHTSVEVEGVPVPLAPPIPKAFEPPQDYTPERTTLWSFPDRGSWATHQGNYRGNWSPYIPRNLILKYTAPGDLVLDPMCGSGTTLVECMLLGRNGIGVDVNPGAAMLARSRTEFVIPPEIQQSPGNARIFVGDARQLYPISSGSVDLVAMHPPYANIIRYSRNETGADLSAAPFPAFVSGMKAAALEAFRVLKQDRHCGVLVGDTRKRRHVILVSLAVLDAFLAAGFVLKEDIIKAQHNTKGTKDSWRGTYDFYLLAHEHLYIFRKPSPSESTHQPILESRAMEGGWGDGPRAL